MARGREGPHALSSGEETDRLGEHHKQLVSVRHQLRRGQLRPYLFPGCQGRRSLAEWRLHAALHPDAVAVPSHLWRSCGKGRLLSPIQRYWRSNNCRLPAV